MGRITRLNESGSDTTGGGDISHFPFVVIGAGPCGGRAAIELAAKAGPGNVALIGEEPHPPYERPPLSKKFLTGASTADSPNYLFDTERLERAGVVVRLNRMVTNIDPGQGLLTLSNGGRVSYGRLLIATGAVPRRLSIPGAELPGIHYLRDHADASALREVLATARSVLVVGGGFIGLEAAASARSLDLPVTVVEAGTQLMGRAVPASIAAAVLRKYQAEGVVMRVGIAPLMFSGDERVESVALSDGTTIAADVVIVGIGGTPNVTLAEAAGIAVRDGILVDRAGQTSVSNVFAAGDVASRLIPELDDYRRLEAWEPAIEFGVIAATGMLEGLARPERAPWMWSDQFDWNIQSVGFAGRADTLTVVGDCDGDSFIVLLTANAVLVGAVGLNRGKDIALCRRAVARGASVDLAGAANCQNLAELLTA